MRVTFFQFAAHKILLKSFLRFFIHIWDLNPLFICVSILLWCHGLHLNPFQFKRIGIPVYCLQRLGVFLFIYFKLINQLWFSLKISELETFLETLDTRGGGRWIVMEEPIPYGLQDPRVQIGAQIWIFWTFSFGDKGIMKFEKGFDKNQLRERIIKNVASKCTQKGLSTLGRKLIFNWTCTVPRKVHILSCTML